MTAPSLFDSLASRSGLSVRLMGVVNATPDSFHDGGRFASPARATAHALRLADEGADLLDVGGESTRPGAAPVPTEEEIARVLPVIEGVREASDVPISIDTYKAETARRALAAGASIVNDVSGGAFDPAMAETVARAGAGVVLGHAPGRPEVMQRMTDYADVVAEAAEALGRAADRMRAAGVAPGRIAVDPGIGFGKTLEQNLALLSRLDAIRALGYPVLVGASRKSFIGRLLAGGAEPAPTEARLYGSVGAALAAIAAGAAALRVHDVRETREAALVFEAARRGRGA